MQELLAQYQSVAAPEVLKWVNVGKAKDFPANGGACIKYKHKQIAVFNFTRES